MKWRLTLMSFTLLSLTGCRKDLCYDHNHVTNLDLRISYNLDWHTHRDSGLLLDSSWEIYWTKVHPIKPAGVRLITYPDYAGLLEQKYNIPNHGRNLTMSAGRYKLLFYNNDTEYIQFNGIGDQTIASTRTRTRISHSELYPEEITVNPPDMLYGAFFEDLMIKDYSELPGHAIKQYTLDVKLMPRVFSYVIRYEFKAGLEYVRQARGALSGMAGSILLSNGNTDNDPVTLLFDCTKKPWGCETTIRSFGIPEITLLDTKPPDDSHETDPEPDVTRGDNYISYDRNEPNKVIQVNRTYHHRLNLELYLINGKEKQIEIDVTDQVNRQPRGGVIVVTGLEVTDKESSSVVAGGNGGGFDTSVDGWEDDILVEIPID